MYDVTFDGVMWLINYDTDDPMRPPIEIYVPEDDTWYVLQSTVMPATNMIRGQLLSENPATLWRLLTDPAPILVAPAGFAWPQNGVTT